MAVPVRALTSEKGRPVRTRLWAEDWKIIEETLIKPSNCSELAALRKVLFEILQEDLSCPEDSPLPPWFVRVRPENGVVMTMPKFNLSEIQQFDQAAAARGLNRTAYMRNAVSIWIDRLEAEQAKQVA